MTTILLIIIAYLFGSFPTGKVLGIYHGLDIQKHGSGNIGFANSVRVLGWPSGITVLIVDITKGLIPLLVAKFYFGSSLKILLLMGLASVLGHAFPIWLKFKGGKSIATGLGIMLALHPYIALSAIAVYCSVFAVKKISAAGSLAGAWSLPVFGIIFHFPSILFLLILALFATYTHRTNITSYLNDH